MARRRIGAVLLTITLLTGCEDAGGDPADADPTARPDTRKDRTVQGQGPKNKNDPGTRRKPEPEKKNYPWSLPGGDNGLEAAVGPIYQDIIDGKCDAAEEILEGNLSLGEDAISPIDLNEATILRAGIAMCRGDETAALRLFKAYRFPGYPESGWYSCQIYAVAGSVLLHRAPSTIARCPADHPGGDGPGKPTDDQSPSETADPGDTDPDTGDPNTSDPDTGDQGGDDQGGGDPVLQGDGGGGRVR
ncbi:hypothetical protein [Actinocorallia longicatena]|uniref:Tetratricopeptide repeat protein n=1 Tax=Actinocorallia longicatena TaxID=111803 RepID=A0ABP6QAZ5_9ACTN